MPTGILNNDLSPLGYIIFFPLLSNNGPAKSICNSSLSAANSGSGLDELNGFDGLIFLPYSEHCLQF